MNFRITNWDEYQHYKSGRNSPWVRLYRSMLNSEMWVSCDDASRLLAISCILLAGKDGVISGNETHIRKAARLDKDVSFQPLLDCGFLAAIDPLADCEQDASKVLDRVDRVDRVDREVVGNTEPDFALTGSEKPVSRWSKALWTRIRAVYPKREGGQKWVDAESRARGHVRAGASLQDMLAGTMAYAAHCDAAGKTGTPTTMQAATFFGKNRMWTEIFDAAPPAKEPNDVDHHRDAQRAKSEREWEKARLAGKRLGLEPEKGENLGEFALRVMAAKRAKRQ